VGRLGHHECDQHDGEQRDSFASASVPFTTGPAETSATLYLLSLNSTTYYDDAVLRAN
jgi:hypothetical protein